MKGAHFGRRLGFALRGIAAAFARERSFRTQTFAGATVLAALLLTRPAAVWWAIAALASGLVLVAELVNTAFEALLDRVHPERHPEIRIAKDVAAGAVLVASVTAVLVALAFILA